MLVLAGLCVAIGLVPGLVLVPARLVATGLLGGLDGGAVGDAGWVARRAARSPLLGSGLLALMRAACSCVRRWLPVPRPTPAGPDVGLRVTATDTAHAVHRLLVCRAPAGRLRSLAGMHGTR